MVFVELLACNTSVASAHQASQLGDDVECSSFVNHTAPIVLLLSRQRPSFVLLFASIAPPSAPLWLQPFAFQFLAAL